MRQSIAVEPMPAATPRRGSFLPNIISNLTGFAVSVSIGFWYTPFLVRHLGTAAYGLIPLVTSITSYMSLLTNALNQSVARFLTVALEKENGDEANLIFNSSFFAGLVISGVLLLPGLALVVFCNKVIRVPAGYESQVRELCLFTVAAFVLNTVMTAFGASTFARNRFDLRNAVDITQNITRIAVTVVLFQLVAPRLWHVGLGIILAGMISAFGLFYSWRKLTPGLRVDWNRVECRSLSMLGETGVWVVVYQVGTILFLGIDLLVINRLFGAETGGRYAVVLQWSALLRAVGTTISAVFAPTIMSLYARNDMQDLYQYAGRAIKILGLALALPIGLICGLPDKILLLWLGPKFVDLAGLMQLLIAPLGVNLVILPLFSIDMAVNKIRVPALVTVALGAVNLALALVLARQAGFGMYGVAIAGGIVLTAKNLIFTSLYTAHNIRKSPLGFFKQIAVGLLVTLAIALGARFAGAVIDVNSWARVIGISVVAGCLFVPAAYWGVLNLPERLLLTGMLQRVTKW